MTLSVFVHFPHNLADGRNNCVEYVPTSGMLFLILNNANFGFLYFLEH